MWPAGDRQAELTWGENGGREEIRTLDLLRAREALSQLSYPPTYGTILPASIGGVKLSGRRGVLQVGGVGTSCASEGVVGKVSIGTEQRRREVRGCLLQVWAPESYGAVRPMEVKGHSYCH